MKASGKRVSFQMLYERLQGKDYGVRKGVLPLFLAWKFYLLEGMPVLYLGNKELLITVEVLNNINQFPESYDLYIEKKDMEKSFIYRKWRISLRCADGKDHTFQPTFRHYGKYAEMVSFPATVYAGQ